MNYLQKYHISIKDYLKINCMSIVCFMLDKTHHTFCVCFMT